MITKRRSDHRSDPEVRECESRFTSEGRTLQKITIISKISSNKNCSELNFLKETQWTCVSISPRCGAGRLQRLPLLKYYDVLEWESRFALQLNTKKSTDYIIKYFKQKLFKIKFPVKNSPDAFLYLPQKWN